MKPLLFLILVVLAVSCRQKGVPIPSIDLVLVDSTKRFNTSNIPTGRPIALLYFNPGCSHCQDETIGILKKMDSLKDVRFYFITNDDHENMRLYNEYFKLYNYKNIIVGRDYKFSFPALFKDVSPPYLVLCDEYKRIRVIFKGETEASKVISFVNKL